LNGGERRHPGNRVVSRVLSERNEQAAASIRAECLRRPSRLPGLHRRTLEIVAIDLAASSGRGPELSGFECTFDAWSSRACGRGGRRHRPGPALSAALGAVDPTQVPSGQVVELLRAQSLQSAHEQARLWATLLEVGLAVPADDSDAGQGTDGPLRVSEVSEWAVGEVAAALTWTDRAAYRELGLAKVVVRALPDVFAALWDGRIDRGKAVVFADYLDPAYGVTAAQTKAILARILPVAPRLTTAQLRGRLWRAVVAVDPGWARRR
jgi:hypothetical protein